MSAALLDEAVTDVLAHMTLAVAHRAEVHSTNPLEPLSGEVKGRTEVVCVFPNETAIVRLVGAILLEQSGERVVRRARRMRLESVGDVSDSPAVSLPIMAA